VEQINVGLHLKQSITAIAEFLFGILLEAASQPKIKGLSPLNPIHRLCHSLREGRDIALRVENVIHHKPKQIGLAYIAIDIALKNINE